MISLVSRFTSGLSATIQVWENGTEIVLSDDSCPELDDTGIYAWNTGILGKQIHSLSQYHYRIIAGEEYVEGDFVLQDEQSIDGGMSGGLSSYIRKA